jgi:hypothetical protein
MTSQPTKLDKKLRRHEVNANTMTSAVNFNVTVSGDDVITYLEGGVLGQGAVKIPLYLVIG